MASFADVFQGWARQVPGTPRRLIYALPQGSAAEPDVIDSICVKFLVVRGTAVMVLLLTKVPVEEAIALPARQRQTTCSVGEPGSKTASSVDTSDTLTTTDIMSEVLNSSTEN